MNKLAYKELIHNIRTAKKPDNVSEDEMQDLKKQYPGDSDAQYGTAWKISKNREKKNKD